MKKKSLVEYAKKIFEIGGQSESAFSSSFLIESLGVSPTQARRILKELHQEGFLSKEKLVGQREPIYVINDDSEGVLAKLEGEAMREPKKQTKTLKARHQEDEWTFME